jgi:hypothetical protein
MSTASAASSSTPAANATAAQSPVRALAISGAAPPLHRIAGAALAVPHSALELETAVGRRRRAPLELARYLQSAVPDGRCLETLFARRPAEPDTVSAVLAALAAAATAHTSDGSGGSSLSRPWAADLLRGLSRTPQFATTTLMFGDSEAADARAVFAHLRAAAAGDGDGGGSPTSAELEELQRAYRMT